MERIVVAHCHHSTTEVPLQVGNRFQAEKRCSPCPSHAFSFHRCVGNGAITPLAEDPWKMGDRSTVWTAALLHQYRRDVQRIEVSQRRVSRALER